MTDPAIEVVHVGSASRDITDDDPRGWRLGGGVTYAALTTARLGLRTAAVVGVDVEAANASELDQLREAGVELLIVRLAESPAFRNDETPGGRIQTCVAPGHPSRRRAPAGLGWRRRPGPWSRSPARSATTGRRPSPRAPTWPSGWQGLLRDLVAGRIVARRPPEHRR